jgi:hypothetical protein
LQTFRVYYVEVDREPPAIPSELIGLVGNVTRTAPKVLSFHLPEGELGVSPEAVLACLRLHDLQVHHITSEKASLEMVFAALTAD